jgi:ribonucleoside-diphosphate reductase subunit M1
MKHRPIGIGVQGLADVFMEMLIPYESKEAQDLNQSIFEHLYYFALKKSNELAIKYGHYQSFLGSPLSKGLFHFDLYKENSPILNTNLDWESLRQNIKQFGTRNSLLIAPMPTASTSQILGNTESFEPLTSNYYLRRTNAGEFYIINPVLNEILTATQLWNDKFIEAMIIFKGSIQYIKDIPQYFKNVFKNVWEMDQMTLINMASTRQYYIDQSQSFNLYLPKPEFKELNKLLFHGWKSNLKTGCYYLRTRPAMSSQNFTIDPEVEKNYLDCESCSA